MLIAASAENTMFKKVENVKKEIENKIIEIETVKKEIENVKKEIENEMVEKTEIVTNEEIHDSDDDMIVITFRETCKNETNQPQEAEKAQEAQEVQEAEEVQEAQEAQEVKSKQQQEEEQKGEEFFLQLKDEMESKKLFPLMSCNMVSAFGCAMQHVEYLDITNAERKAMATELVKCLAYSNNEHGARECFDYLFQNNMTDDIIKTIIDCTKDRYDINKYPHTNRNIVLSCVSLSKKVKKTTQPKFDLFEDLFEFNFKFNLCYLKRFFKIKDGSKSV